MTVKAIILYCCFILAFATDKHKPMLIYKDQYLVFSENSLTDVLGSFSGGKRTCIPDISTKIYKIYGEYIRKTSFTYFSNNIYYVLYI